MDLCFALGATKGGGGNGMTPSVFADPGAHAPQGCKYRLGEAGSPAENRRRLWRSAQPITWILHQLVQKILCALAHQGTHAACRYRLVGSGCAAFDALLHQARRAFSALLMQNPGIYFLFILIQKIL